MNKMNLTKQIWFSMGFLCVAILTIAVVGVIQLDYVFDKLEKDCMELIKSIGALIKARK